MEKVNGVPCLTLMTVVQMNALKKVAKLQMEETFHMGVMCTTLRPTGLVTEKIITAFHINSICSSISNSSNCISKTVMCPKELLLGNKVLYWIVA